MVVCKDMVEILYYSENKLDGTLLNNLCRQTILFSNLPIISVTQKPTDFGRNIVYTRQRGRSHSLLYKQILTGLKASTADYMFFTEHDVLYSPSHFDFVPTRDDVYYYNRNVYKYRLSDRKVVKYDTDWLSQICASRELLIKHYETRLDMIAKGERAYGYEPGTGQSKKIDNVEAENWYSEYPSIDIRHGDNWTGVSRMDPSEFRNKNTCLGWWEGTVYDIPGWNPALLLSL